MSYIGRDLRTGAYRQLDDISSGFDGSDTTHTMQVNSQNVTVGDVNQIILSLGGVIQKPGTDFTVSGSTLTFTTAPAANTSFFAVLLGSDNGGTVTPTDVSVTKAKLADEVDIFAGTSLSAADLGSGLHIKTADSGLSSIAGGGDELIIEGSGDSGLSILSGASNDGNIFFGDSGDADTGYITYDHSTNHLLIGHGGVNKANASLVFHGSDLTIGTNSETSPDTARGGICLNQGGADTSIMTFKSSDIAHGMTDVAETDTWAKFTKESAANGGLIIQSLTEGAGSEAFKVVGYVGGTSFNTGKSTSTSAIIEMSGAGSDGSTGDADVSSNGNIMAVMNRNTVRFLFDAEGDFHADSSSTTFDAYEDAHLVRAYDLSHGKGVIDSKFDKFVSYNHEKLADLQLVGREDDGTPNHFINVTGMQRLHNGAIWQQYEKHQRLAEAVYEMAKEALGEDKADAILKKHDIKLLN
jgi:hypothetical protein